MAEQKNPISLLPGYLQTDTLKKVFSATVDHLFSSANIEFLNGYIGDKPAWYNSSKDVYITEPNKIRADYQLTPTTISSNYLTGQVTNAMFYDDLIGQLRFQGANVSNHDRLFSEEYYSWAPPIDIDKFVNFGSYFWLPNGPNVILLLDTTDLAAVIGTSSYTYQGSYQLTSTGQIFSGSLEFVNGLKIKPTKDLTLSYNDREFYVEGIGREFVIVETEENRNPAWDVLAWDVESWDGTYDLVSKQYVTINRASIDGNIWSRQNRWFHASIISITQTYISDQYQAQALRPIIEFDAGIELYQYGTYNRGIVDLCDIGNGDFLGTIVGQPSYKIQDVSLQDGMRILSLGDVNPNVRNRIYIVSGVSLGAIQLTLDTSGRNSTGAPTLGDRLSIRFGSANLEGKNAYFDGSAWILTGQQKFGSSIPLFNLYDTHGNRLDDPSVYASNNFAGSLVFSYSTSTSTSIDTELGIPLNYDQFGDYIFNNNLTLDKITYTLDNKLTSYVGDLFVKINSSSSSEYINGWWKSQNPSRQYIVNTYQLPETTYQFQLDQTPADRTVNSLPTIFVLKISASGQEIFLLENVDYTVNGNILTLTSPALDGERVIVKTWNSQAPETINGYYELPRNISANPNNLPVTNVSRSQILNQFIEIIQNQYDFAGTALGSNNYKDTAQNRSFGLSILQHRAPMLKLALLNSTSFDDITNSLSKTDPMQTMDYAQRSYITFYNRFVQTLFNLNNNITLTGGSTPNEWISKALSIINVGKNTSSPWANSGPSALPGQYCSAQQTNPTYVPASPTRLGIMPSYEPIVYMDTTYTTPKMVLQTHDGARIVLVDELGYQLGIILHNQTSTTNPSQLSNPVAAAWLQFELNLYNSLPATYKDENYQPVFNVRTEMPGRWRTTDYNQLEFLNILRGSFDKWIITNQVDFSANTGYETTNQFSYNYRSTNDPGGMPIPGHWQGIYRWYYDTDRPHSHPWEMLGFSIMPSWWTQEYGPAPYTSGNLSLWTDLRDGYIRQGSRAGINEQWARPGLLSCIPVDDQGNLLPPYFAGCTRSIPSVLDAQASWIFGDGSPVESVWINSSDYKFALSKAAYLMKPARFIEYNWDTLRTEEIFSDQINSQWVYIDTNSRRSSQQFYVHRENPSSLTTGVTIPNESSLTYFGSCGFQHWTSEYLISNGYSVTQYFGNIIRGGDVKLAHKMAGFTPTDSFRALVDSFGQIGYNSRLIPSENINLYLYKSTSIGESVYSGIIIRQVDGGWQVRGYDAVNPYFTIIPSDIYGTKTNIVVGNQRVVEYSTGLKETENVLYDTVFSTRQQVYDFIISYGRWLESQGWTFEIYDGLSNTVDNWSKSAKEFLFWSQGVWDNGTFITVSPSADTVHYSQTYGNIQYITGNISGTYPILDRAGQPIQQNNLNVYRDKSSVSITATNDQGIFLTRLFRNTLEHAVFFDNTTAFNDVMYQPLFNLFQSRILIYAYRAKEWDGRVDIPGYIIVQNTTSNTWNLTSNFDKSAEDFMNFFKIEQPTTYQQISPGPTQNQLLTTELGGVDTTSISNLAKHLIGYQSRDYLQNLLLDDATEFEFYQGFIRQKGTASTLNKLLRNNSIIPIGSSFQYNEEWLFRTAWYGGYNLNSVIEFILPQDKLFNSPQQIRFFGQQDSDNKYDAVFDIVADDPLIITPPDNYFDPLFKLRTSYNIDILTDLPTAGYAQLGETTFYVKSQDELLALYDNQKITSKPITVNNTVWQFITDSGNWTILRVNEPVSNIAYTVPSNITGAPTTIVTSGSHGLIEGDICIIFGIAGASDINGTYVISNVTSTTFQISISTFTAGTGGTVWVYRPTRFANIFDRDSNTPPSGWVTGDLCYVDEGGIEVGAWTVYKYIEGNWLQFRQQKYKVDASLILSSELFNTVSKNKLCNIDYFDPAKGRIVALADAEINYKTDYDPAKYNSGNSTGYAINVTESWDNAQLGQVWWDLTTVRYIDYDQGDSAYQLANWGKLAPGTSIDVYEWIRSPISPADWTSYAAQGQTVKINGETIVPQGTVRNPNAPNWSEYVESNSDGTSSTYYYFWVKNSFLTNFSSTRRLTTQDIATLIASPSIGGVPWFSAIGTNSIIIGNVTKYLNSDTTMQRIRYKKQNTDANDYSEWQLVKENDPDSLPSNILWEKMKDSLVTFDGLYNDVPYYRLTDLQKYGNFIRPRQTWFENRIGASELFVSTVNSLFANLSTPLVTDSSKVNWSLYFNAEEPEPSDASWNYHVTDLGQRDALIGAINVGQKVLVDAVSSTNNRWTIWQYNGAVDPWTLIRTQYYKVPNYWIYVDWYASGYSSLTTINYTVDTISELQLITSVTTGSVAKVLNDGSNKWQLYSYDGLTWVVVGQQDGSVEIQPSIYNWAEDFGGFDGTPFDSTPMDQTAGLEFSYIIDGIKNAIFATSSSLEINKIFFTMIRFVLSEQRQVDWAIKTSNISLKGFQQPLDAYKLLPVDLTESIVGFLNETKPYHVKISELLTSKVSNDLARVSIVDFDVPPGFYPTPPDDNGTLQWSIYNSTYQSWLANYKTHSNLIRNLKTTLIFDRIATSNQRLGWSTVWDQYGWSNESSVSYGAIDRIEQYYNPTPGMIPKIISELMIGVDFRSTVLDGLNLHFDLGWSMQPWDSLIGWEPSNESVLSYIDLIVQGGQIPRYDMIVGNGIISEFNLLYQPQNPLDMVVWADGQIRKYGTDWIVPTHAKTAFVVEGGINYTIGDELDVLAGTGLAPVRLVVTSTNHGSITGVEILGKGSYQTVTRGPYQVQYPSFSPGPGTGATVDINWECTSIQFTAPPNSSNSANIYILYAGTTFEPAPLSDPETVYSGSNFVIPHVDSDHPEEYYPAKVRDALILDTYVNPVGGRPLVNTRVYKTDGIQEQFDIGITPENNVSVYVYHNGTLKTEGLGNDYVINFVTNKIVFLLPPAAGIVRITAISVGGGSRSVESAYVVTSGHGYHPGDLITISSGVGSPAQLSITSVTNETATIAARGQNYNVGDLLTIIGGTLYEVDRLPGGFTVNAVTMVDVSVQSGGTGYLVGDVITIGGDGFHTSATLTVNHVSVDGVVTGLTINNGGIYYLPNAQKSNLIPTGSNSLAGSGLLVNAIWGVYSVGSSTHSEYTVIPSNPVLTNGNGTGVTLNIDWGASKADVAVQGLYTRLPSQPVGQQLIIPAGGTGATWNLAYTRRLNEYVYSGDDVTTDFTVPGTTIDYPGGILVFVDGYPSTYSRLNNGIRLPFAPAYGSPVIINTFDNAQYSLIEQTSIHISNPAILSYPLSNRYPAHTMPYFTTTLVRQNGLLMQPPVIETWFGNGYNIEFPISVDITNGTILSIQVYIDSQLQVGNYNIVNNSLVFNSSPAVDSEIVLLCLKDPITYTLSTVGGTTYINFAPGAISLNDNILVTTFAEDADYNFVTEEFFEGWSINAWDTSPWDGHLAYPLAQTPYDLMTISVWVNGQLLTPGYDYIVENDLITTGWDKDPWDTTAWQSITDPVTVVKIADSAKPIGDHPIVTITYMVGLPERPPVAWRTLLSESSVRSTAIDDNRKTTTLSNVFVTSTTIEIEDITRITVPNGVRPEYLYINNELIGYYNIQQAPTAEYPLRGFVTDIMRNVDGTTGTPTDRYAANFFNGDNSNIYFPTEPVGEAIAETVWVNENLQRPNIDYTIVLNPPSLPPGRYAKLVKAPSTGYKNVKIVSLNMNSFNNSISHITGSTVIDAGTFVKLPNGYHWEPNKYGIQYGRSTQSTFLLDHSGTRS